MLRASVVRQDHPGLKVCKAAFLNKVKNDIQSSLMSIYHSAGDRGLAGFQGLKGLL